MSETRVDRKHRKMICIDSRSRMSHENANKYTATFKKIKNVIGIDLVGAEIPYAVSGNGDFYVYVGLETYGSMESSDGIEDIFAKVSLDSTNRYTKVSSIGKSYDEKSPLSVLCHLNIWLKLGDGSLYDFHDTNNALTVMITYLS